MEMFIFKRKRQKMLKLMISAHLSTVNWFESKTFSLYTFVLVYMLTLIGEKPCKCEACDQYFVRKKLKKRNSSTLVIGNSSASI